jgi:hypothetical protein
VEAELAPVYRQTDGRTDRQTDRQIDVAKVIIAFRDFANRHNGKL